MPYAFVQDVAASWEDYQQVAAALIEPAPEGLILHIAGRFEAERLAPAIAALGGPARPEATFRDFDAAHIVAPVGALGSVQRKEKR